MTGLPFDPESDRIAIVARVASARPQVLSQLRSLLSTDFRAEMPEFFVYHIVVVERKAGLREVAALALCPNLARTSRVLIPNNMRDCV